MKDLVSSLRWPAPGSEAPCVCFHDGFDPCQTSPSGPPSLPRHLYPPEGGGGLGDHSGHSHQAEPGPAAAGPQGVLGPGGQGEGDRCGRWGGADGGAWASSCLWVWGWPLAAWEEELAWYVLEASGGCPWLLSPTQLPVTSALTLLTMNVLTWLFLPPPLYHGPGGSSRHPSLDQQSGHWYTTSSRIWPL